jgi:hypothetical protein
LAAADFGLRLTLATLQQLISMVEKENHEWQRKFDEGGHTFDFFVSVLPFVTDDTLLRLRENAITNAQYELVVLQSEHFLPKGSDLTVKKKIRCRARSYAT